MYNYQRFILQRAIPLNQTDINFEFLLSQNKDLFIIQKSKTGSKTTEIHVLSHASNYQQFILHTKTALPETNSDFQFLLALNNDLFIIQKNNTGTKTTEIHVLSATTNYQQFILHTKTALPENIANCQFLLGTNNDLFVIQKSNTGTQTTEIHVLSKASNYLQYIIHTKTILPQTSSNYHFLLSSNNDLFAIQKSNTASKTTEINVLSANSNYQQFSLNTKTVLHETDSTFEFLLASNRDLYVIKKSNTDTKSTEIHVLENCPQPIISDFSPKNGVKGTNVRIFGENFINITAVKFNGLNANFSVVSDTEINAVVTDTGGQIIIVNACGFFSGSRSSFTLQTIVPNIIGQHTIDAEQILKSANLRLIVPIIPTITITSNTVFTVIEQQPSPGQLEPIGNNIKATLALAVQTVTVFRQGNHNQLKIWILDSDKIWSEIGLLNPTSSVSINLIPRKIYIAIAAVDPNSNNPNIPNNRLLENHLPPNYLIGENNNYSFLFEI